ncbi:MAG: S-layer homology domain-containing protein [Oscillospiraceae bacterium]|nr:S-layer homology domain-containing protein [Oscillospiraceae bacterium]
MIIPASAVSVSDESDFSAAITNSESAITISADMTLTSTYTINYDVEIISDGATITWVGAANGTMFSVTSGATLTLENTTLDGNGAYMTLVNVNASTFVMNDGAVLQNVYSNSANNAVKSTNGAFIMNGGLITGVHLNCAVYSYGGTVTMRGDSSISANSSIGVDLYGAELVMTEQASISGNEAAYAGVGVLAAGASTVTMGLSEGDTPTISNNTATGASSYAGGIFLSTGCTLNMDYDAQITDNTSAYFCGGVGLAAATLNMAGNARISGNTAANTAGGGVFSQQSTVTMTDNATICDNIVSDDTGIGGGVYLKTSGDSLTMRGAASITGNQSGMGDGVYIGEGGVLNLSESITITDGLYFNRVDDVPVVADALGDSAVIQLEASDYVAQADVPLTVAVSGTGYAMQDGDYDAFLAPVAFGEGYYVYGNESNDEAILGLAAEHSITYLGLADGQSANNPATYYEHFGVESFNAPDPADHFIGWFDAEIGGTEVTSIPVTATTDYTLWARFESAGETPSETPSEIVSKSYGGSKATTDTTTQYTVYFDTQGGSPVAQQRVVENGLVQKPEDPTRAGYFFDGWYLDPCGMTGYDFDAPVTERLTLYAKWRIDIAAFTDIDAHWAYEDILSMLENGYMDGVTETQFEPDGLLNRAMMVTILYAMECQPEVSAYQNPFSDVEQGTWYTEAVTWAANYGIIEGYGAGVYGPMDALTREQMATILYRYAAYKGVSVTATGDLSRYSDAQSVSDWALPMVRWCVGSGWMHGRTATEFVPQGTATRAEIAKILHLFSVQIDTD